MKIRNTLTAIIVVLLSCLPVKAQQLTLKEVAGTLNSLCPVSVGITGEITSAKCSDEILTLTYSVNELTMNFDVVEKNMELWKRSLVLNFKNTENENLRLATELLQKENKDLRLVYTSKQTGKVLTIYITPKDIAAAASLTPLQLLEDEISMGNLQLPLQLTGMTMESMKIEGENVVYTFNVDETTVSIEALNQAKEQVKASIMQTAKNDLKTKLFAEKVKKAGKSIRYKYIGTTSGQTCIIVIYNSEL